MHHVLVIAIVAFECKGVASQLEMIWSVEWGSCVSIEEFTHEEIGFQLQSEDITFNQLDKEIELTFLFFVDGCI